MPATDQPSRPDLVPFRIEVHPERGVVRVAAVGELDLATAAQLQAQIAELRRAGFERVVLDLRQLTFMDSSGVSLILDEERSARRKGQGFALIGGPPPIQRVLSLCVGDGLVRLCSPASRTLRQRTRLSGQDGPALSPAMRSYLAELRHQARPRRHAGA